MITQRSILAAVVFAAAFSAGPAKAATLYVDDSAVGSGTGTSWSNAFTDLGAALTSSQAGDQIWVAQGHYLPSSTGGQGASFDLKDGVAVYGGFAGTEATLSERAGLFALTILSGDLAGDDGPAPFDQTSDNSGHVVVAIACGPNTILDGFTVVGGHDQSGAGGGGLRILGGGPRILRCRFESNQVAGSFPVNLGGAVYSASANPVFTECDFIGNRVHLPSSATSGSTCSGGAVFLTTGNPQFRDCRFEGNSAIGPYDAMGGAIGVDVGSTTELEVLNCDFIGNEAIACCVPSPVNYPWGWGGAIHGASWNGATMNVVGSRFLGNQCDGADLSFGGAISWSGTSSTDNALTHCVFSGNRGGLGVVANFGSAIDGTGLRIEGCVIAHNVGVPGLGSHAVYNGGALANKISNTIIWGNTSDQIAGLNDFNYSCIQTFSPGGGGVGNIGLDPMFVLPAGQDGVFGTEDDDLRLQAGSPCVDAGSNLAVSADELDFDGDGDVSEPTPLDVDGTVRFWDDLATADTGNGNAPIVDMGALEFHGDVCQPDLGYQGPGNITLNVCGDELTGVGSSATLQIASAPSNSVVFLFAGFSNAPTLIGAGSGGLLVPFPPLPGFPLVIPTDANGNQSLPVLGGGNPPLTVFLQVLAQNGAVVEFSNAVEMTLGT